MRIAWPRKGPNSTGYRGRSDEVEVAERVALRAALQLGITTHAANNLQEESIKPDGTSHFKTVRDSDGAPRGSALRKKGKSQTLAGLKVKETAKAAKPKTLLTKKPAEPKKGRKRPKRPLSGKAAAKAIANTAKRVQATKEFLTREATKLALSAAELRAPVLAAGVPVDAPPSDKELGGNFLSLQACEPLASVAEDACRTGNAATPRTEPTAKRPRLLSYERPKREKRGDDPASVSFKGTLTAY